MNTSILSRMLVWITFLSLCFVPVHALAQSQTKPAAAGRVTLDFKNVELTDLIQTISELTGKNFLYDETVQGKATIISPDSMTLDAAYQLFLTVLNVKGFTVVPSGNTNKIVPLKNAKESSLPTVVNGGSKVTEQVITRVFRLKYLDAAVVAPTVLFPLMPPTANVSAYAPGNSLIITDTGANIERLAKIIYELDQPEGVSDIEVVALENSKADDIAKALTAVMSQPDVKRRVGTSAATEAPLKIIPYAAGRCLIVMASKEDMAIIKTLIARMDKEIDGTRANIHLCYLENADAVTLAVTLNEILTGVKTGAGGVKRDGQPVGTSATGLSATGLPGTGASMPRSASRKAPAVGQRSSGSFISARCASISRRSSSS